MSIYVCRSEYNAENGSIEMVKLLIDNGANFNAVSRRGYNIVHFACMWADDTHLLQYLMGCGFYLKVKSTLYGETPLILAAKIEIVYEKAIHFLIKMTDSVNDTDNYGNTALHYSANKGTTHVIKCQCKKLSRKDSTSLYLEQKRFLL